MRKHEIPTLRDISESLVRDFGDCSADPVFDALKQFHRTRRSYEENTSQFDQSPDQFDAWCERFEGDLEAVRVAVPTTPEGFEASIAELAHQMASSLGDGAARQWLRSIDEGIRSLAYAGWRLPSSEDRVRGRQTNA
ncbi:MAG: hypothetical protein J0I54_12165 [Bosea sp.]|uniref:hypothetical protein n=1 Tax=unclassified Bosea (in: a-proteobacteria) TaxID=2653178 RepID=UPI00096459DD|nr:MULTISPECIES: hypothetical protein [unclassified Bosea (in: a-proteobacteria)]MBN9457374.1 hypothetical protein [Bosea sp. (in: a-proteobacteria)]OJV09640.1 MAG: hypothetical protein BGO20_02950 [Bosea sp. 67-29]